MATKSTPNLHKAARWYAALGWHVFPCKPRAKIPMTEHGVHDATTDLAQIDAWWSQWPDANIGVATGRVSNIFVLDFDVKGEDDGGFEAFEEEHGEIPDGPISTTGGGVHRVFSHPGGGRRVKNSVSELAPGLDVRGDGGYVIVPPSIHPNGRRYAWDPLHNPREITPPAAPDWLVSMVTTAEREPQASGNGRRVIPKGRRNDALFRDGCAMRARGFGYDAILAALLLENEHSCQPPLETEEVEAIATSAAKYDPGHGTQATQQDAETDPLNSSNSLNSSDEPPAWPTLDPDALHGLAGDVVRTIGPHTEADDVALLVQILIYFGNAIGRRPHCLVEADYHALNENAILVGPTSKARKGTSAGHVRRIFKRVDPEWAQERVIGGLSSGEGLIWAVRDPIVKTEAVREKGRPTGEYQEVIADQGVSDKRLLVLEEEFAAVLRRIPQDGNSLSAIIRQAWDSGTLRVLTKNSPAVATGAHISVIGHITRDELLRYLDSTEAGNGFGNRFLWCCVKRSKALPEGGSLDDAALNDLVIRLRRAVDAAASVGVIPRDEEARGLWREVYPDLSEGRPGLLGAMTSRSEAHVMRLSALYALLDCSPVVQRQHLIAALALWEYCEASARFIFGQQLGDPLADELLRMLRGSKEGLTRTDISNRLGRNRSSAQIMRALNVLEEQGLATHEKHETDKRPAEVWKAT